MFCIEDNIIKMTKGDTVEIEILLQVENGQAYTMQTGDTLTMTIAENVNATNKITKVSTDATISFTENDTKNLNYNEGVFDIVLTKANGKKYTIVGYTGTKNIILYERV